MKKIIVCLFCTLLFAGMIPQPVQAEETLTQNETQISMMPNSAQMRVGYYLRMKINPNEKVQYSSGNTNILTVNQQGVVYAVGAGNTYVYAKTADGKTYKSLIKVYGLPYAIKMSKTSATTTVNRQFYITSTVYPANVYNGAVSYVSGNEKILKVNEKTGLVTTVGSGTTYVYAKTANGVTGKTLVKVCQYPEKISLNPSSTSMLVGKNFKMKSMFTPANTNVKGVTYTSGNTKILKVTSDGTVTAVGAGTTYVYAKTSNGLTAKSLIKVYPAVTSIKLNRTSVSMEPNKAFKLTSTIAPANAGNKTLTYTSSNPKVVSVNEYGTIRSHTAGTVVITVTSNTGVSASCKVTVIGLPENISLNYKNVILASGEQATVKATLKPANASSLLTWSTSTPSVASVNSNGTITAHRPGFTFLTAKTTNGKSVKIPVQVKRKSNSQTTGYIKLDSKVNDILDQIIASTSNDHVSIIKGIQSWIMNQTTYGYAGYYDYGAFYPPTNKAKKLQFYSELAYEPIFGGRGVCDDYAAAFRVIAQAQGYEVRTVHGTYAWGDGSSNGHTWNQIKLDGVWYHIDTQADDYNDVAGYWTFMRSIDDPEITSHYTVSRYVE